MIRFEKPAVWAECDSWFLQDMAEFAAAPSEDIWKKFECLAPFDFGCSTSLDEMLSDIETELGGGSRGFCSGGEIRHHDCMWAGLCHSKEHRLPDRTSVPAAVPVTPPATSQPEKKEVVVETPAPEVAKAAPPPQAAPATPASKRTGVIVQRTVGRSLLLNKAQKAAQTVKCEAPPERPETPQSLSEDEEESGGRQRDEDWTPDKAVSASEVTNQVRRTAPPQPVKSTNVQFDHNYDKSNGPRLEDLGLQTPSDSEEEEIDVVSVTALRGVSALPTNPSRAVKAELQETVASITAGKLLSAASEAVSRRLRVGTRAKRKEEDDDEEEYQPKKRARKYYHRRHLYHHHHHHQSASPRKTSRFSTDSETDTTEKRSQHNNMERMRRIDLRNAFEELRNLVPGLVDASRAAKVTILKDAAHYCYDLTSRSKALNSELLALRREQDRLRSNLSKLRRNLAARR